MKKAVLAYDSLIKLNVSYHVRQNAFTMCKMQLVTDKTWALDCARTLRLSKLNEEHLTVGLGSYTFPTCVLFPTNV